MWDHGSFELVKVANSSKTLRMIVLSTRFIKQTSMSEFLTKQKKFHDSRSRGKYCSVIHLKYHHQCILRTFSYHFIFNFMVKMYGCFFLNKFTICKNWKSRKGHVPWAHIPTVTDTSHGRRQTLFAGRHRQRDMSSKVRLKVKCSRFEV